MYHKAVLIVFVATLVTIVSVALASRQPATIPNAHSLVVPFSTQAPDGNWRNNENCEETSALMAKAYLEGKRSLDPQIVAKDIEAITRWEQEQFGYHLDTGAQDTARFMRTLLGLKVDVVDTISADKFKEAISQGSLVLLPLNAQELLNPAYADGTRLYHMVVVYGYDGNTFFVHDPGTSSGEHNAYPFSVLEAAAADWDAARGAINTNAHIALIVRR